MLAIEENTDNSAEEAVPPPVQNPDYMYKQLKNQRRLVKARENRLQNFRDEIFRAKNTKAKKKGTTMRQDNSSMMNQRETQTFSAANHSSDGGDA